MALPNSESISKLSDLAGPWGQRAAARLRVEYPQRYHEGWRLPWNIQGENGVYEWHETDMEAHFRTDAEARAWVYEKYPELAAYFARERLLGNFKENT